VARLSERGHDVVGLARNPAGADRVRSLGGRPAESSLFDVSALTVAARGAEVVIHAATSIPSGRTARSRGGWSLNDRIRREGTRSLTSAAGAVGARRYLQMSVAWVVKGDAGRGFFDESTSPDPPELLRSAVDGERIAVAEGRQHGFSVCVLREGAFYGPDTSMRDMARRLRARRLPVPGRGEHLVAPIHVDDMAAACVMAVEAEAEGTWNVVDDEPVPFADLLGELAARVGAPPPRHLPLWLARWLLGSHVLESLTTSMNTSNARIRRELGWAPSFPTCREGLDDVVETWVEEGFLSGRS